MKFNEKCPICLDTFKSEDIIKYVEEEFYHEHCLNQNEELQDSAIEEMLKQLIYNYTNYEEYVDIPIDKELLLELSAIIVENKYVVIFSGSEGHTFSEWGEEEDIFAIITDALKDDSIQTNYVVAIIKDRSFVYFEEIPRYIRIV